VVSENLTDWVTQQECSLMCWYLKLLLFIRNKYCIRKGL